MSASRLAIGERGDGDVVVVRRRCDGRVVAIKGGDGSCDTYCIAVRIWYFSLCPKHTFHLQNMRSVLCLQKFGSVNNIIRFTNSRKCRKYFFEFIFVLK